MDDSVLLRVTEKLLASITENCADALHGLPTPQIVDEVAINKKSAA
jgi:hypothetical protein